VRIETGEQEREVATRLAGIEVLFEHPRACLGQRVIEKARELAVVGTGTGALAGP
jgi:hypothetical protein